MTDPTTEGRRRLARRAATLPPPGSPAAHLVRTLSPAARHVLVALLGGPLVRQPRGWCGRGRYAPVCLPATLDGLVRQALVITALGGEMQARLTPHGREVAAAIAADMHEALTAAGEIGRLWLANRQASAAADAAAARRRLVAAE
ncbi:hypothetical protein RHODGE_RHODGE_02861 [Rhodoplanes serenus]|uniref:HTH hxlR-type domain-containing protein n=1 Tax=Rhodoplanes serenus TaxID=200615 RepID=A0A3S4BGZ9_9BRAD|nr:hypothetical protein [Rhodoplanes serenus]MBI5111336.1 hypothetical protein [Rhodovulum sp.]VCU09692.1 hypothetical protein RHODGE_RHODGE_02861 [Rhodoplanes serenus]